MHKKEVMQCQLCLTDASILVLLRTIDRYGYIRYKRDWDLHFPIFIKSN